MYIYIILARDIADIFTSYFLKSPQVFYSIYVFLSLVRSLWSRLKLNWSYKLLSKTSLIIKDILRLSVISFVLILSPSYTNIE